MSLSVADVLALPGLSGMRLRAGHTAQHQPIRWTYLAENPGIADWVIGGELVFVTGIGHPRDEANLLRLLHEAHERRCAGMVILVGEQFIQAIPASVVTAADRLGVPLVEQPYALKMVLVTHAIGTALVQAEQLARSRRHVLEVLLDGDYQNLELLLLRAEGLGLGQALQMPRQVALFKLDGADHLFAEVAQGDAEDRLQAGRATFLQRLNEHLAGAGHALPLVGHGQSWIALLPEGGENRQALAAWLQRLNTELAPLRVFLGLSASGHTPAMLPQGLGQARQALAAAQCFPERLGVCSFNALGTLELLAAIRDRALLDRFVERILGPLVGDDSRHRPVLIPTLQAWFQENGNLARAAERLHVHRNTLNYRLQRIEALSGCSFEDPHDRLNLSIALLIRSMSSSA